MSFSAVGAAPFAREPLAGDPLHDPPTVVVSTLGTVSAGGPTLAVDWTYAQEQGEAQQQFRVVLSDDAESTIFYDSGFLSGAVETWDIDIDAEGVPHDTSDITARVYVRGPGTIGQGTVARYEASDSEPFVLDWGVPHATILEPDNGEVWGDLEGVDVEWSFGDDDVGNTQAAYRVRLELPGIGLELWDTGWVVSTDTTYRIPVQLNPGSLYRVYVQLKNNHGIRSD